MLSLMRLKRTQLDHDTPPCEFKLVLNTYENKYCTYASDKLYVRIWIPNTTKALSGKGGEKCRALADAPDGNKIYVEPT